MDKIWDWATPLIDMPHNPWKAEPLLDELEPHPKGGSILTSSLAFKLQPD